MDKSLALVIEDHIDASVIFTQALQSAGFETEGITTGDEALKRLESVVPQVIVLDLHLPHVSGMDILDQIRADDRFKDTKIIIATAHPQMAESLQKEADLVLVKPVGFSQLRNLAMRLGISEEQIEE